MGYACCMSQFFWSVSSIHILIPNYKFLNVSTSCVHQEHQSSRMGLMAATVFSASSSLGNSSRASAELEHRFTLIALAEKLRQLSQRCRRAFCSVIGKTVVFHPFVIEQLIVRNHKWWFTEYYTSQISQYKLTIDHNHPKSPISRRKLDRSRPCGNKAAVVVLRQEVSQQLGSWSQTLSPLRLNLSLRILYMPRCESILILNDFKIFP